MTDAQVAVTVIADEPITGVAERVAAMVDDLDDQDAGEHLQAMLARDRLSLPAERGLPDVARRIVARLRGRQVTDDLGEAGSSFELYGLHVPPGGRAALEMSRSAAADRQVSVQAIGLGFGGGRKLTIAIEDDIAERAVCMRVLQHITVRVRRLGKGPDSADPIVMTDVVAWGRREMAAWPDCPHCGPPGTDFNPLDYEEDVADEIDLRTFDAAVKRQTTFTLEGSRQADVGLDLPLPSGRKLSAGFHLEQQTSITCTATFTFPAGGWFVPYRRRGEPATLPYWAER